jgi:DsbC/DsbD-like thiol-disulfide interchange protein
MNGTRTRRQGWIGTCFWGVLGVTFLVAARASAAPGDDLVKPSLLADVKTAAPGKTFHVGMLLKLKPDWHVYWENPGDSGSPTRLKITAPPGVTVGPVQYPLPKTFNQPGDVVGYGYEREVMLIAPVTLPGDWPADKPLQLRADGSWLVCKDVCLPGKAKLELTIPVAKEPQPDNTGDFQTWAARLPAADPDRFPFKLAGAAGSFKLTWDAPVQNVQVLTVAPDGVEVADMSIQHKGTSTTVISKLRTLEPGKAEGAALGVLLTYDGPAGQRQGARLSIPLSRR